MIVIRAIIIRSILSLLLLILLLHFPNVNAFSLDTCTTLASHQTRRIVPLLQLQSTRSSNGDSIINKFKQNARSPVLDDIPLDFQPLFNAAANATALRGSTDTSNQGHDSFRYEWGTWIVETSLQHLMHQVDTMRLQRRGGIFEKLLSSSSSSSPTTNGKEQRPQPRRYRIATGQDWDVLLHVLPEKTFWRGRWPTGSWSVLKTLTGMAEICALSSGPASSVDGYYSYKPRGTIKKLAGGSDGSLGGSQSSAGQDCIKYVGGPLRQYLGAYGKTTILEVIIRPPIGADGKDADADADVETVTLMEPLPLDLNEVFAISSTTEEASIMDNSLEDEKAKNEAVETPTTLAKLGAKMGTSFDAVGGLDTQLAAIARRVLASRANPAAARRLGVSHVRGILLSGPPGCGKTLLARELARILGAREPQIVNGPEILDKFIGEAEKKVRDLFAPAEREYQASGDDSALHIIILDEMDAIARKRGSMTSDTTGVRDSVVNQLLAKMDGVREASNVLVVGLTNRPELLDPALLRPGRLEVQLRIELPDQLGRRDILRIHTRKMNEAGGITQEALKWIDNAGDTGLAAHTEHFSGAELAGLVRSAASFALARTLDGEDPQDEEGIVSVADLKQALREVRPALGKQDEMLKARFPLGISPYSSSVKRILRDLERFTSPPTTKTPRLQSLLLVGAGGNGGAGATALAAWAASQASTEGKADYVRFITALDLLAGGGDSGEEARAAALVERFAEAREMPHSLLVLDDVDQLCAGRGPGGYSSILLATLRALLRSPPSSFSTGKAGGQTESRMSAQGGGKTIHILASTSRSDAACVTLYELFDETIVIPLMQESSSVQVLLHDSLGDSIANVQSMADLIVSRLGEVGCKTALRLAERAVASAKRDTTNGDMEEAQLIALAQILDDLAGDEVTAERMCEVI